MGGSLALKALERKITSLFVGQWAAPFLLLGIYNKLVKLERALRTGQECGLIGPGNVSMFYFYDGYGNHR